MIDIADYLNGLAMQKYRPSGDEIGIPVLKIKELRQGYVIIIVNYVLRISKMNISFMMAMLFFLGLVVY